MELVLTHAQLAFMAQEPFAQSVMDLASLVVDLE
jgi:hypothetical protein